MLARNFAPAFPVELVEKDLGYLADETKPGSAPAIKGRASHSGTGTRKTTDLQ